MEFVLFSNGEEDEHNGVGFVEILKIFLTQGAFSIGIDLCDHTIISSENNQIVLFCQLYEIEASL